MPAITIRNLPEQVLERLRERARRNRRSLNAELVELLERSSVEIAEPSSDDMAERLRLLRESSPVYVTQNDIDEALRRDRDDRR